MRFLRLTKPGGLIGVIVPESIVAGNRLAPLRLWLTGRMDVCTSTKLPQKVFSGVGAPRNVVRGVSVLSRFL